MKNIFSIILILTILSACTERIELELDSTYTRLVVEGNITSDIQKHGVRLSKTTAYFGNQAAPAVSDALVSISDGASIFHLTETSPGVYLTEDAFAGEVGKTYTLNIELQEEIAGYSTYNATSRMMPIGAIDSIGVHYIEQWEVWEIQLYAQEPATTDFYMFNWMKNNILMTDTINEVNVSDDKFFNGSYSNGVGVGWFDNEREDEKLNPGDTVTLIMSTINENYADFIWEVQTETGYNNPLFGGPPANINGNISNGALGFFAAYANRKASTIVK